MVVKDLANDSLNSCLYHCDVMHHRWTPVEHRFEYRQFVFCMDLDELDTLASRFSWFGLNRLNLYGFSSDNYMPTGTSSDLIQRVKVAVKQGGIDHPVARILLITHLKFLGLGFNPVSFYICLDQDDEPVAAVAEVTNTYYETKLYVLEPRLEPRSDETGIQFEWQGAKYFYVSPFAELADDFRFNLAMPGESCRFQVDTFSEGISVIQTAMTGTRLPLTTQTMFQMTCRYPAMAWWPLVLIHWQAFKLWLKKVPFHPKHLYPELQRRVLNPHASLKLQPQSNVIRMPQSQESLL